MRLFLSALLTVGTHAGVAAQGCPAVLELSVPQLSGADRKVAQLYADCMTAPNLTSSQGRIANMAACRANLPLRRSAALEQAVRLVDETAIQLGACNTRVAFKAKK
jgi:hypothetical protein